MDGTIGEIRIFAAGFAPRNWAMCSGQLVAIQANTALFAILGNTYGGNGSSTFGLPNFNGRVAIGTGQGPGGTPFVLGEYGGEENHVLMSSEMPIHTHAGVVSAASTPSLMVSDADSTLAAATAGSVISTPGYTVTGGLAKTLGFNNATPNTVLHPDSIKVNSTQLTMTVVGGSSAHNNMQPFMAINHIICLYGTFPARN